MVDGDKFDMALCKRQIEKLDIVDTMTLAFIHCNEVLQPSLKKLGENYGKKDSCNR
jgi:hypothetical protein